MEQAGKTTLEGVPFKEDTKPAGELPEEGQQAKGLKCMMDLSSGVYAGTAPVESTEKPENRGIDYTVGRPNTDVQTKRNKHTAELR